MVLTLSYGQKHAFRIITLPSPIFFSQSPIMASLSPEQVKIIKSTVPVLQEHGNKITTCFYEDMLAEIPDLNNVCF